MRYKEIDINIKAIPDKEDEALLNQLMGAKGVSVSDADDKIEELVRAQHLAAVLRQRLQREVAGAGAGEADGLLSGVENYEEEALAEAEEESDA